MPGLWPLYAAGFATALGAHGTPATFIRRKGPAAVLFSRFIAFFRAMTPVLAGICRMPYRTFLLFNALGGLTWGVGYTLPGYLAGSAYTKDEHLVGRPSPSCSPSPS
jgi:membrane protein DedA with SNARE-associated domain